jgi:undecaprenyl-phosphate galactose phosphotransferase
MRLKAIKFILRIVLLVGLDVGAYYLALSASVFTRANIFSLFYRPVSPFFYSFNYFASIWWIPLIFVFVVWFEKLYRIRYTFWEESKVILKATAITILFVFFLFSVRRVFGEVSRLTFLLLWFYLAVLTPVVRYFGKKLLNKIGIWTENVLVLGAGETALNLVKGLYYQPELGYHVIGFLDDDKKKAGLEIEVDNRKIKVFGAIKNFNKFINMLDVSTVMIALPHLSREEQAKLTMQVQKVAKSVMLMPDLSGIALVNTELHYLFMQKIFLLKINNNLLSGVNQFVKKVFDIFVSILILPLLLPILAVFGVMIRLDSPGPIFIIQDRLGRKGKVFKCVKFRTMYQNADRMLEGYFKKNPEAKEEWKKYKKLKGFDPRVTKIGNFLRKTSLDELPQIFNVLKGDMCLVGPRPYLPREWEEVKDFADMILLVTPGITGLWQISGRNDLLFEERMKLDTWYVQNWSLWLDFMILFKTAGVLIKREGAY